MVMVLQRVYNYIQNSPLIVAMHPWQKTLSDFSQWEHLDDGDGIESTPKVHRADHKKCRLQFNKMAFDEQSRGAGQQQCSASTVHTRSIHSHPQPTEPTCFFCKEPAGSAGLHRTLFAQFGVPETVVSVNGSCFVSEEFSTFLLGNGVKHITSAPYRPATNGLAERAVQIVKKGLKKCTGGTLACRLARVLFAYRSAPQSTGVSPAELLLGRQPRTKLDLLKPNTAERVESKQLQQKANHDNASRDRGFTSGALVYAKNFGQGQRWWPGNVVEVTGPVSYRVSLESGHVIRRHQDHLRIRRNAPVVEPEAVLEEDVEQDMEQDLDPVVPDVPLPMAIQPSIQPSI